MSDESDSDTLYGNFRDHDAGPPNSREPTATITELGVGEHLDEQQNGSTGDLFLQEAMAVVLRPEESLSPSTASMIEKFHVSLIEDDVAGVIKCLEDGASPDKPFPRFLSPLSNRPIFLACENGNPEMIQILLDHGAGLNPDSENLTPLMILSASHISDREVDLGRCAKILLDTGKVDVSAAQDHGMTALM